MRPCDDPLAELLRRTAQGEEGEFAALYDATRRRVFGLILRILRDWDAAEETTLETYATVWQRAVQYDPRKGNAMTWILAVGRSKAIDRLRSRKRHSGHEQRLDESTRLWEPPPGPEAVSSRSEQVRRVSRALAALPKEQREVIETAFFGGLSHTEVAAALGQPLGTVKTRIRAGLTSLRRLLAEE